MTSVIKKSVYFILGFCLILPMINNSAVAASWSQNMLTVSPQSCVAGSALTQDKLIKLHNDLQSTNVRIGGSPPSNYYCSQSVRAAKSHNNSCESHTCTEITFRTRNGHNLSQEDFDQLNSILTNNGIRSMMFSNRNPGCLYYCGR